MKAIILLSGGLDSTVMLAMALQQEMECIALSFDYGQRNRAELLAAQKIALYYGVAHQTITIDPAVFQGSALLGRQQLAKNRTIQDIDTQGIPNTYVPARNTLFLAYAMGLAEQQDADEIHLGANANDKACYPDCRPEFIQAFQGVLNVATCRSAEKMPIQLKAPLLYWNKTDIVRQGIALKAPLDLSLSCYDPMSDGQPCHTCDACVLRKMAFAGN